MFQWWNNDPHLYLELDEFKPKETWSEQLQMTYTYNKTHNQDALSYRFNLTITGQCHDLSVGPTPAAKAKEWKLTAASTNRD